MLPVLSSTSHRSAPGPHVLCPSAGALGAQVLCPEVHAAKHLPDQGDEGRRQEALWTLQAMNECAAMLPHSLHGPTGRCAALGGADAAPWFLHSAENTFTACLSTHD